MLNVPETKTIRLPAPALARMACTAATDSGRNWARSLCIGHANHGAHHPSRLERVESAIGFFQRIFRGDQLYEIEAPAQIKVDVARNVGVGPAFAAPGADDAPSADQAERVDAHGLAVRRVARDDAQAA